MLSLLVALTLVFGVVSHSFDFHISQQQTLISPGVSRLKTVVNNQFPGPLIRVPYGSHLQINVYNDLDINGTSIHWHGLLQHGTPYSDGLPTFSQCPILSHQNMSYNFQADPSGTTFWHAHFHTEQADGLYGPFIVDDQPDSFPFDYDEERVILMTDSYDSSSWALEAALNTPVPDGASFPFDPTPNQGLLCLYNETESPATSSCSSTTTGEGFNLNFIPGKTYRLRLICAAELAPFLFSIDEHELQVVAVDYDVADGTAWVNSVPMASGQRYDVLVRAREDVSEGEAFWVRATMQPQCWPFLGELNSDVRGVLTYGNGTPAISQPSSVSWNATNPGCEDLDYSTLKPAPTLQSPCEEDLDPALTIFLNYTFPVGVDGVARTFVNGNNYNVSDDAYPTLFNINEDPSWQPTEVGEQRNLLIVPDSVRGKEVRLLMRSIGVPGAHPFHLHGGGFKVVASGPGNFTQDDLDMVNQVDVRNVISRDTVMVPSLGWVMTQFTADNPGVWAMHCHVGWHFQNGMLGQIVQLPEAIASEITISEELKDMCRK